MLTNLELLARGTAWNSITAGSYYVCLASQAGVPLCYSLLDNGGYEAGSWPDPAQTTTVVPYVLSTGFDILQNGDVTPPPPNTLSGLRSRHPFSL
jgi:hypothetical protein